MSSDRRQPERRRRRRPGTRGAEGRRRRLWNDIMYMILHTQCYPNRNPGRRPAAVQAPHRKAAAAEPPPPRPARASAPHRLLASSRLQASWSTPCPPCPHPAGTIPETPAESLRKTSKERSRKTRKRPAPRAEGRAPRQCGTPPARATRIQRRPARAPGAHAPGGGGAWQESPGARSESPFELRDARPE